MAIIFSGGDQSVLPKLHRALREKQRGKSRFLRMRHYTAQSTWKPGAKGPWLARNGGVNVKKTREEPQGQKKPESPGFLISAQQNNYCPLSSSSHSVMIANASSNPTAPRTSTFLGMSGGSGDGMLSSGIKMRVKPIFAASFMRSTLLVVGRSSPVKPISPNATTLLGVGFERMEDTMASMAAKSQPVSVMRAPPVALRNTFWSKQPIPVVLCRTANNMDNLLVSMPTAKRFALGLWDSSTSAWISINNGRVPSLDEKTHAPLTGCL